MSAPSAVYKYPIPITDRFSIEMPYGHRVLSAQMQNGVPVMWAAGDPTLKMDRRWFYLVGTGNPMQREARLCRFIDTIQDGSLVWHLWESSE